jgi:hypothetical protein
MGANPKAGKRERDNEEEDVCGGLLRTIQYIRARS